MSTEHITHEFCIGCGHSSSLHFNDVTGVARGILTHIRNPWGRGYDQTYCECKNFELPDGKKPSSSAGDEHE